MTDKLLREDKPTTLKLGDGKEYELTPLNLNMMIEIEDKFGEPLAQLFDAGKVKVIRYLLFVMLKPKYPDMTEKKVGESVTAEILNKVGGSIAKDIGVK